eukprot:2046799-Pleurochrysis_carterae.AAC.2
MCGCDEQRAAVLCVRSFVAAAAAHAAELQHLALAPNGAHSKAFPSHSIAFHAYLPFVPHV